MLDDGINKNVLKFKEVIADPRSLVDLMATEKNLLTRYMLMGMAGPLAELPAAIRLEQILRNPRSSIIAVKCVNVGQQWDDFLTTVSKGNSRFPGAFPATQILNLYPFLEGDDNTSWVSTILTSPSTYLIVARNRGHCAKLIKRCIKFESDTGGDFFEILFWKEQRIFIDFRRATSKQAAAELRKLYLTRRITDILRELGSCDLSAPFTCRTIPYTSLTTGRQVTFHLVNGEIPE